MKKTLLIAAAGLVLPMSSMADSNLSITFQANNGYDEQNCRYEKGDNDWDDNDDGSGYSDYSEPSWYDNEVWHGPAMEKMEYQWCIINGHHTLRFRKVVFHHGFHSWNYGHWQVRFEICVPGCRLHHVHHFYDNCSCPLCTRHYTYMHRHYGWEHGRPHKVTRYYYYSSRPQPEHRYYRYESDRRHEQSQYRNDNRSYEQPQYRNDNRSYEQPQPQPPVRRPSIRPVPNGTNFTDNSQDSTISSTGSTLHKVNNAQPIRKIDSGDRSTDNNIQKKSGRIVVWQR